MVQRICIQIKDKEKKYLSLTELLGIATYSLNERSNFYIKGKRNSPNIMELESYNKEAWTKKKQIKKEENRENERRFYSF